MTEEIKRILERIEREQSNYQGRLTLDRMLEIAQEESRLGCCGGDGCGGHKHGCIYGDPE